MSHAHGKKPDRQQEPVQPQRTTPAHGADDGGGGGTKPTTMSSGKTAATVGGVTATTAKKKSLDASADADFAKIEKKDGNNKSKIGTDVGNRLLDSYGKTKYEEQLLGDADRKGALAQSIDRAGVTGQYFDMQKYVPGAVRDGAVKGEDVINAAAKDPANSTANAAAHWVTQDAVGQVDAAKSAYDDKVNEKAELDARMAEELAKVGPGLTDAQRQKFVQDFQQEHHYADWTSKDKDGKVVHHKGLNSEIDEAAANLDHTLQKNLPTLEAAAKSPPKIEGPQTDRKDSTDAVSSALEDLAGSDSAIDALKMSANVMKDKSVAKAMLAADSKGFTEAMDKAASEGFPRAAAKLLADADKKKEGGEEEKADALEQLEQIVKPFETGYEDIGAAQKLHEAGVAVKEAAGRQRQRAGAIAQTTAQRDRARLMGNDAAAKRYDDHLTGLFEKDIKDGKFDALKELGKDWEKEKPSGIEAGFAAAELVFGAHGGAKAKSFTEGLKAISGTAEGLRVADESLKGLTVGAKEGIKVGDTLARFAPGIGVIANLATAGVDASNAAHGDVGAGISVAGDLVSAVGSGIDLLGPEAVPIGTLVDAAGTIISGIGTGISLLTGHGGESTSHEATRLLEQQKFDKNTAQGLGGADASVMKDLTKMGVSRQQLLSEAKDTPNLLSNREEFDDLRQAQAGLHIKDKSWNTMVETMVKDEQKRVGGSSQYASLELGAQIEQDKVNLAQVVGPQMQALAARDPHLRGKAYAAKEEQLEDKYLAEDLQAQYRDLKNVR